MAIVLHFKAAMSHAKRPYLPKNAILGIAILAAALAPLTSTAGPTVPAKGTLPDMSAFWRDPGDVSSLDLYYGVGGKKDLPKGPFTFVKEDRKGTSVKFTVRDSNGVKWKAKVGGEAGAETAASRLVWAAGYYVDEDYFLPELKVENLPVLHRGEKFVSEGGVVHNVRMERDEKNLGHWTWKEGPFTGTRPWNGLRVMMALTNCWDLKLINNGTRVIDGKTVYLVTDLGASFGATGFSLRFDGAKGNLSDYEHSKFITKVTPEYVDFETPDRPLWARLTTLPQFFSMIQVPWFGQHIPIEDAHWIGQILSGLTDDQIKSAFRGSGFSEEETRGFSSVVERRISQLASLR